MSERSTWFSGAIAFALLALITLVFAPQHIEADIQARASTLTAVPERGWAQVVADGRELSLFGAAPGDAALAALLGELRRLRGVHGVTDHTGASPAGVPAAASDATWKLNPFASLALTARERAALARRISPETCQQLMDGLLAHHSVRFSSNSAVLRPQSLALVAHLATAAVHCPDARLTVAAHTDDGADSRFNRQLSTERARAVAEHLSHLGVRRERLGVIGHGADHPVADNATPQGRALNRRIEITVEH